MFLSLYPQIIDRDDLEDLYWRSRWYFRGAIQKGKKVVLPIGQQLENVSLPSSSYLVSAAYEGDVELSTVCALEAAVKAERVIVWNHNAYWEAPAWLRRKAKSADELCEPEAAEIWSQFADSEVDQTAEYLKYTEFVEAIKQYTGKSVLIIGSGPSLGRVDSLNTQVPTVNLYGGSSIWNEVALRERKPHFILAPDIAACLGPSLTAARYRSKLYSVIRSTQCRVLIPEVSWRPLKYWWPEELKSFLIPIPSTSNRQPGVGFDEEFSFVPTGNVLTSFMLPTAASIADEIQFIGIDGRSDNRTGNWQHLREEDYQSDLFEAKLAHGRLHVTDLESYYREHSKRVVEEASILEERGVKVFLPAHFEAEEGRALGWLDFRKYLSYIRRFFDFIAYLENRHLLIWMLSAVSGGGLVMIGMINIWLAIFAGAAFMTMIAAGYFSLRLRITRKLSYYDRAHASQLSRTMQSLSARIKKIERKLEDYQDQS